MGIERGSLVSCVDHGFGRCRERPEGGERQSLIAFGIRLKFGVIGSGYGPPDGLDHRAAGGVGLARHGGSLT